MKRTLKFLLIGMILLAVSFTMAGCGKDDDDDDEDKGSKKNRTEVVNNTSTEELGNLLNTTVNTNTTGGEDVHGTASYLGTWNGNTYINEFLGVNFKKPSSWVKADDDDLTTDMGMMVQDQTTGDNVIVQFEDLPSGATAELIYENLKTGLEAVETMNYSVGELKTEDLAGKTFKTVTASVNYSGISMVQKYYILVHGDRAGYIIITVTDASRLNTILSYFEKY